MPLIQHGHICPVIIRFDGHYYHGDHHLHHTIRSFWFLLYHSRGLLSSGRVVTNVNYPFRYVTLFHVHSFTNKWENPQINCGDKRIRKQ